VQVVVATEVPPRQQGANKDQAVALRGGATIIQRVFRDTAPDGLTFGLNRIQFLPGEEAFTSSRHHHAFQQIRWAESGSINFAPGQFIPEGDIAYFPRGAYYGPQLKDQGVGMTVQLGFGGEKQSGKEWAKYNAEAMERLKARGRFEGDTYIEVDQETGEEQRREAVDAFFEEQYFLHTGEKWVVPAEGYEAPILMHPQAFEYYDIAPGVEMKRLGSFYDHPGENADVRIAMLRLSQGEPYDLGPERAQLAWSKGDGLQIAGKTYPEMTCVYSPRDEKVQISGESGVEVYLVEFPRLD
jgi:hypothetical protein